MAGQLAYASLPLLQESLSLPLLTEMHLLLRVLESPASSVPDFQGPYVGPWALDQGSGMGVLVWRTPCALSGTLFLCAPGYCSMRTRSCADG